MLAIQQGITSAQPRTPPGRRVYAVGDVHGRYDLLEQLLEIIMADAEIARRDENILIFVGDYIDRGPDSRQVIERLSMPPPKGFKIVCLKGNHEDMLLQFLEGEGSAAMWFKNGGRETLKSYGLDTTGLSAALIASDEMEKIRLGLRAMIPDSHIEFFTSLDLIHVEGDYFFVHAGIRPSVAIADQKEADLIWIRNDFLQSDEDFGKIVVHGHSITFKPTLAANMIGIDTGAWRSDVLTCLVLDGAKRRFLST